MKRFFLFTGILPALIFAGVCCTEELEQVDPHIVFELYDVADGKEVLVRGTQQIAFGETKTFKLKSAYLTSVEPVSGPAGWDYKFSPGTNEAIVTAPLASDANADQSGVIVVQSGSYKGAGITYRLEVTVCELTPEAAFAEEPGEQIFGYGATTDFPLVVSSSVSKLEIETPEAWSATYELGHEPKLTVAAPAVIGEGAESGTIRITPVSPAGSKGESIEMAVVVNNIPAIYFQETEYSVAGWAGVLEVDFTYNNVLTASIGSQPEGWSVDIDLPTGKMRITAPADDSNPAVTGGGEIRIDLTGAEGVAGKASVCVRLNLPGIVCAQDFLEFGAAVASGAPIDERMLIDGIPTLATNIDLTGYNDRTYFAGSESGIFNGTFDGNGKTVRMAVCLLNGQTTGGLFHTVGSQAVVRNLKVEGTILSLSKTTGVTIGGVAAISQGALFQNITTDIDFTFRPDAWFNFSKNASQYGSITGKVCDIPGEFSNCISKGDILLDGGAMRSVGGQIGVIEIDGTKLTDCTSEGAIYLDVPDAGTPSNVDNTMYGGLVGNSECWETQYLRCINRGDITIDLHYCRVNSGTNPQIYGVGGIAGVSFGTFTECTNYGKIWAKEASGTATRRYGGILGGSLATQLKPAPAAKDTKNLSIKDCINEGDILHSSPFVGGIAGMIMQGLYAEVVGCVNRGDITNQTLIDDVTERGLQPQALGGVIGQFRGNLVKDCINEGTLSGQSRHHVGGIVGFGRPYTKDASLPIEVINCENKGAINVSSVKGSKTAAEVLQVGGVISIHDGIWKIVNCRNSGSITSTSDETGHVFPIYVCRPTGCTVMPDAATDAEQAKTDKITDIVHK